MRMKVRQLLAAGVLASYLPAFPQTNSGKTDSTQTDAFAGDFFIVSSIDLGKKQILLKRPTEVTELMRVDRETRYFDEHGKAIRLTDLRAGDTVYIASKASSATALAV